MFNTVFCWSWFACTDRATLSAIVYFEWSPRQEPVSHFEKLCARNSWKVAYCQKRQWRDRLGPATPYYTGTTMEYIYHNKQVYILCVRASSGRGTKYSFRFKILDWVERGLRVQLVTEIKKMALLILLKKLGGGGTRVRPDAQGRLEGGLGDKLPRAPNLRGAP